MLKIVSHEACWSSPGTLNQCKNNALRKFTTASGNHSEATSAAAAPRVSIDTRAIRLQPHLYSQNCLARKYISLVNHPYRIVEAHQEWLKHEGASSEAKRILKATQIELQSASGHQRETLVERARQLKNRLSASDGAQKTLAEEIKSLAIELPNLTSPETPLSDELSVLELHPPPVLHYEETDRDHVRIGAAFELLDFGAAAASSGWGFYFLLNEAEKLEQALIQYARKTAQSSGFRLCSPPSLIYSDIGTACGFRPRDQNGEQQVYTIQQRLGDTEKRKPSLSLAGTAEIPFAAMKANHIMDYANLPCRVVGSSRCYRAEAGARGRETRGLYRVHEFSKVEMFAWTLPNHENQVFDEMVAIQRQIISSLDLPFRRLEMPAGDLGASAYRKQDIEVFFPSRKDLNGGWGEVTSTSICTDYQTRRLNTRTKLPPNSDQKLTFPSTINGTAMAVPRVIAAIIENGWDNEIGVRIPKVLWPWMDGQKVIHRRA